MILLKENYFIGASKENLEYCIDLFAEPEKTEWDLKVERILAEKLNRGEI